MTPWKLNPFAFVPPVIFTAGKCGHTRNGREGGGRLILEVGIQGRRTYGK